MPSNLTPTTRECVHLVKRGHFRSRDKDGGHTARSILAVIPMLHADFTALRFTESDLLPVEFHIAGIGIFDLVDFDFSPMTFIYELDPYSLEMRYTKCANVNLIRQDFRKLSYYRHTYRQTDATGIIYHAAWRVVRDHRQITTERLGHTLRASSSRLANSCSIRTSSRMSAPIGIE